MNLNCDKADSDSCSLVVNSDCVEDVNDNNIAKCQCKADFQESNGKCYATGKIYLNVKILLSHIQVTISALQYHAQTVFYKIFKMKSK